MPLHGSFWWNELATNDVEGAKAFYAEVLGWTFEAMPVPPSVGSYWCAMTGDRRIGGVMGLPDQAPPGTTPYWLTYIAVDDIDASAALVAQKGGTVMVPPFDIAGVGRMAVISDPQGAVLALVTSAMGD